MAEQTFESDEVMEAFVAGWFAHAQNPKDAPLLVEDAWHAYRLIESAESADTCRVVEVDGQPVRVRGAGEWDEKDREAFGVVVRAASSLLAFHTHDEWSGMCSCGEGPFTRPEWARHVSTPPGASAAEPDAGEWDA